MPSRVLASIVVVLPHLFLMGLIFLFLALPEVPPRVIAVKEMIRANESFSITFNKPIRTEGSEDRLAVLKNGERVAGTLKTTATTLFFSPEESWESGQEYRVKIAPLPAERGGTTTEPIDLSLRIEKARVLFLSPDSRLMEGNPETGVAEPVTPEGINIFSFSTGINGHVVALYGLNGDRYKTGVLLGEKQGTHYRLMMSPVVETPRYSQALLCDGSRALLLVSQGSQGDPRVEYFTLDWERPLSKESLQEWKIEETALYNDGDLACSEDTARVLYRKSSGAYVTNFLGEEDEDIIGVFDSAIGFTPKDTSMLLQKSITETTADADYRSELTLYRSDGASVTLSTPDSLFEESSLSGTGTSLSVLSIEGESYTSRIETYTLDGMAWTPRETVSPPQGKRILHHDLSLDGNLVALQIEPGEMMTRVPMDSSQIVLWDFRKKQYLPFEWTGREPQWEQ